MQSLSSARQSEVKAWEEEITACEHTLMLEQYNVGKLPASGMLYVHILSHPVSSDMSGLAHCNKCTLKENLWLCLTCGSLGCGRPQYGGFGGNGHGLAHYEETRHPISVKLGTITPEGTAGARAKTRLRVNALGLTKMGYQTFTATNAMTQRSTQNSRLTSQRLA